MRKHWAGPLVGIGIRSPSICHFFVQNIDVLVFNNLEYKNEYIDKGIMCELSPNIFYESVSCGNTKLGLRIELLQGIRIGSDHSLLGQYTILKKKNIKQL